MRINWTEIQNDKTNIANIVLLHLYIEKKRLYNFFTDIKFNIRKIHKWTILSLSMIFSTSSKVKEKISLYEGKKTKFVSNNLKFSNSLTVEKNWNSFSLNRHWSHIFVSIGNYYIWSSKLLIMNFNESDISWKYRKQLRLQLKTF